MARGGAREGAGKPSSWSSGCKYEDTKLIRIPKAIGDKVLELAHKVDEGIDYEIVTKSLKEENERLREKLNCTNNQLYLPLDVSSADINYDDLVKEALKKFVKAGTQSAKYKEAKSAIEYVIENIRNNKLNQ